MKYTVTHDKFITNRMANVIRKEFGQKNVTYYSHVLGIAWEETEPEHFIVQVSSASEITQFHLKHPGYIFKETVC